ncbi:MAG: hypothetical protein NC418_10905 [Muribaculaceae bacterium]|nr:hypothetical protein [Muribaculaceae bacterium]
MNRTETALWPYLTVTSLLTAMFTLMYYLQPPMMDDRWFLDDMAAFTSAPSWATFIQSAKSSFLYHFYEDNGRIPNLICAALLAGPKWLSALLPGLSVGASIYLGAKLLGAWRRNLPVFALWTAGFIFLPPWYDSMTQTAFGLNYVVSSAIICGCMYIMLTRQRFNLAAAIALAFLAGAWHEANAILIAGSTVALLLCFPAYRTRSSAAWLVGALLALVYMASVPATSLRVGGMLDTYKMIHLNIGFMQGAPFYAYAAALVVALFASIKSKKVRERIVTPEGAAIAGAALAGWMLWRCFLTGYRTAWPMLLLTAAGIAWMAGALISDIERRKWAKVAAYIILLAGVGQPALTLPWFFRFRSEVNRANEMVEANPDTETFFYDFTTESTAPLYTLNRPNFALYGTIGFPKDRVVPATLAGFAPDRATPIGIDCEAYLYDKCIVVADDPSMPQKTWTVEVSFDGVPYPVVKCHLTRFTNDSGTYRYLYTNQTFDRNHLRRTTGLKFLFSHPWD